MNWRKSTFTRVLHPPPVGGDGLGGDGRGEGDFCTGVGVFWTGVGDFGSGSGVGSEKKYKNLE